MSPERADPAYLLDMLEASRKIVALTGGRTFDDYLKDETLRLAVERLVEIVGEAARRVSPGFQASHPEIPWRSIIAQRHVLAHEYGEIIHDRLWRVATIHIPQLINQIGPLIPPPPAADA